MKLLFDFFPVAFFYAAFQFAKHNKELAAQKASEWFGFMVSGGVVGPNEAPTVIATVVVVVAIMGQIVWLWARGKKIGTMSWITLGAALVFGGATVWFHNPAFIKWKFSIVYWLMATAFWLSPRLFGKNLLQAMIGDGVKLSDKGWHGLNLAWVGFFYFMGILNLVVAYNFSENTWFNFKLFGSMGLTLLFALAQALYLARHMKSETSAEDA
ncbi:septation protein A [Uliginosibacterium flavum]|uniref:Inner membrane-spanning protein YciB n=1 Tax=Uliginosibacterium flavum TaxID=1396831 RepID=A0ABV2TNR3_9RHOO